MATVTDVEVANASFPNVRQDLNDILEALATNFSADAEPTTMYPNQFWYETDTNLLKFRNEDNDAWITLAYFDQTNDEWEVRSAVIQAVDSAGVVIKTDDGTTRITIADSGQVSFENYSFPTADGSANQVLATDGSGALSFVDQSGGGAVNNVVTNGAMQVAQRGTSTSSYTSDGYSVCDRWMYRVSGLGTWTVSQDTSVVPPGFGSSTKWECTTADGSPAAGDTVTFSQRIEGQDLQQFKKGLASAEQMTLSFWVRSSKTGTYIVELYDVDNTRHISKSYTIDSADTWEYKTLTYDGDTTGQLDNDNGRSLDVNFWLGSGTNFTSGTLATSWASVTSANRAVGQVNLGDSTSNNWYITGVLLEVGSSASDYPHRSFGEELALCQRYYQQITNPALKGWVADNSTTRAYDMGTSLPVVMRATPSVSSSQTGSTGQATVQDATGSGVQFNGNIRTNRSSNVSIDMNIDLSGALTSEKPASMRSDTSGAYATDFKFDAEL